MIVSCNITGFFTILGLFVTLYGIVKGVISLCRFIISCRIGYRRKKALARACELLQSGSTTEIREFLRDYEGK